MVTQTIVLNQLYTSAHPQVRAVQGDTGRQVEMKIGDRTVASGATGSLSFERSDHTLNKVAASFNQSNNAFTADITQALTQPGVTKCQLKVTESSKVVSTYTFEILVEKSTDGILTPQEGIMVEEALAIAQQAYSMSTELIGDLENDGDYILRRENGQNSYVPIPSQIVIVNTDTAGLNLGYEYVQNPLYVSQAEHYTNSVTFTSMASHILSVVPAGYTHVATLLKSTGNEEVYCSECYGSAGNITAKLTHRDATCTSYSGNISFSLVCVKTAA